MKGIKRLFFRFLLFIGILYGLERTNVLALAAGVGAVIAAMLFLHILATPDSVRSAQE